MAGSGGRQRDTFLLHQVCHLVSPTYTAPNICRPGSVHILCHMLHVVETMLLVKPEKLIYIVLNIIHISKFILCKLDKNDIIHFEQSLTWRKKCGETVLTAYWARYNTAGHSVNMLIGHCLTQLQPHCVVIIPHLLGGWSVDTHNINTLEHTSHFKKNVTLSCPTGGLLLRSACHWLTHNYQNHS